MNNEPRTTGDSALIELAEADTLEKFHQATSNWMDDMGARPFESEPIPLEKCHCERMRPINGWCACFQAEEIAARDAFMFGRNRDVEIPEHNCIPREAIS